MKTVNVARDSRALFLSLVLLLCAACDSAASLVCTTAGDVTGLTVQLSATPVGPYTVDVVIPQSGSSFPVFYTFRCNGESLCRTNSVKFPGLIANQFTVRVTTTLGTRETTLGLVRYTDSYPNGKACDPRSTTATVQAAIPE
jgi:hypothetical protein